VFPQWPAGNRKIFRSRFESISCNLRRKSTWFAVPLGLLSFSTMLNQFSIQCPAGAARWATEQNIAWWIEEIIKRLNVSVWPNAVS
jgi:hypothetical protein